ncbi:Lamin A C, partial [Cichlidogyrus casuarinus]
MNSAESKSRESERYKPITSNRTLVIQRTSSSLSQTSLGGGYACPNNNPGTPSSITSQFWRYATLPSSTANGVAAMHSGVHTILQGREREKKDLQQLNERFATYIEKVRFLEAQNRKLVSELNQLKDRWGKETERVKNMFSAELDKFKRMLTNSEQSRTQLELK